MLDITSLSLPNLPERLEAIEQRLAQQHNAIQALVAAGANLRVAMDKIIQDASIQQLHINLMQEHIALLSQKITELQKQGATK